MSNYPPGCTQADHDRAFDNLGHDPNEPEVVKLDCGHYGTEESAERLGNAVATCYRCQGTGTDRMNGDVSASYATAPENTASYALLCSDCFQRAQNIRGAFDDLELKAITEALTMYGPARMGNHTLFAALMQKLRDAGMVKP